MTQKKRKGILILVLLTLLSSCSGNLGVELRDGEKAELFLLEETGILDTYRDGVFVSREWDHVFQEAQDYISIIPQEYSESSIRKVYAENRRNGSHVTRSGLFKRSLRVRCFNNQWGEILLSDGGNKIDYDLYACIDWHVDPLSGNTSCLEEGIVESGTVKVKANCERYRRPDVTKRYL